jgi:MarR family transcriptional regulator, organic hydroperoxide resistance regulator
MGEIMHSVASHFGREISRFYDSFFDKHQLATSYVELLMLIAGEQNLTQKEIAEIMNLAPSTITRFISKLEKRGYVEKTRKGKEMSVQIKRGKMNSVEELSSLYRQADKELENLLGSKFIETTSGLLKYGSDQILTSLNPD